jgi:glucose uptake protein GlcU
MKKLVLILFVITLTFACKDNNKETEETKTEVKQIELELISSFL